MAWYFLSNGVEAVAASGNRNALHILMRGPWNHVPADLVAAAQKRLAELLLLDDESLGNCFHDLVDSVGACIRLQVVRMPSRAPAPQRAPVL